MEYGRRCTRPRTQRTATTRCQGATPTNPNPPDSPTTPPSHREAGADVRTRGSRGSRPYSSRQRGFQDTPTTPSGDPGDPSPLPPPITVTSHEDSPPGVGEEEGGRVGPTARHSHGRKGRRGGSRAQGNVVGVGGGSEALQAIVRSMSASTKGRTSVNLLEVPAQSDHHGHS